MKWTMMCLVAVFSLGCAGADGTNGADGTDGTSGTNGTNGTNGTDGTSWPGLIPPEYIAADGILGGAAYSKWYSTDSGGMGALADYGLTLGADFVRCKACHAWDGMGNAASYANRSGISTGNPARPDVSTENLRSTAVRESYTELYDLIARPTGRTTGSADSRHPDYTAYVTDAQIWNLIKFMREEWVAPNDLYDLEVQGSPLHWEYNNGTNLWELAAPIIVYSNVGANGDAANGGTIYTNTCETCHGADGQTLIIGTRTLGQFFREKPNEAWFKAKFGEPGTGMTPGLVTATTDLQDLYAALANTTNFP